MNAVFLFSVVFLLWVLMGPSIRGGGCCERLRNGKWFPSIILGIVVALGATWLWFSRSPAGLAAWQWEVPIEIRQPGTCRVEVPPEVLDASCQDLGDLRLISPSGVEIPFLIENSLRKDSGFESVENYTVSRQGRFTVIGFQVRAGAPAVGIEFWSGLNQGVKCLKVEGRKSGGAWNEVLKDAVIFGFENAIRNSKVMFPPCEWTDFKVTIDEGESELSHMDNAWVLRSVGDTKELPATLSKTEPNSPPGTVHLDTGFRNLDVAGLRLDIANPEFACDCTLVYSSPQRLWGAVSRGLASGALYRVKQPVMSASDTVTGKGCSRVPTRHLVVNIRERNKAMSDVSAARILYRPTRLRFNAARPGTWKLLTGNPRAVLPSHAVSMPLENPTGADVMTVEAGSMIRRHLEKALREIPADVLFDPKLQANGWTLRERVEAPPYGLIRFQLGARAMAGSRSDYADLRLVQEGKEVPFLLEADPIPSFEGGMAAFRNPGRLTVAEELKVPCIPEVANPDQPAIFRWRIHLPVENIPMVSLGLDVHPAMMRPRIDGNKEPDWKLLIQEADAGGEPLTRSFKPFEFRQGIARLEYSRYYGPVFVLNGRRMPSTILLECQRNGLELMEPAKVVIDMPRVALTAKLSGDGPLYLYYGNARAERPVYDTAPIYNSKKVTMCAIAGFAEVEQSSSR